MRTALLLLFAAASLAAQADPPCRSAQHAAFDFWVGEWDVTNAVGDVAGSSRVERILDGCVVTEQWTSAGSPYEGRSFNTLDPASGTWTQHYVDNGGLVATMTGAFEGKNLVYHREFRRRDGQQVQARMTFFDLGPGKVRQLVEHSLDGGKTWKTQIDLRYARRAAKD